MVIGEEVEKLDKFEKDASEDEIDNEVAVEDGNGDELEENVNAIPEPDQVNVNGRLEKEDEDDGSPQVQEPRREDTQHSSYRLSEDSDHVRGNLSNEDGGEPFGDAPHYDP
ncbi:unnamed protein product [Linum trigynum]|uniref:Uncharacterized protein n=1 Tax=Linum trigynum TaxID=586398 RepID=A0AAV2FTK1_9ROSI